MDSVIKVERVFTKSRLSGADQTDSSEKRVLKFGEEVKRMSTF